MAVYELDGKAPRIAASAFVHPEAVIIGDVAIGEDCFIAPCSVMRGDLGPIVLGDRVSFQDNAVIHVDKGGRTVIESDVIVGHSALLHDVYIASRSIIGMHSVLMFNVICEEDSIVAAGSVVPQGMRVPAATIVGGNPAKIIKKASERHLRDIAFGLELYKGLTRTYRTTLKRIA